MWVRGNLFDAAPARRGTTIHVYLLDTQAILPCIDVSLSAWASESDWQRLSDWLLEPGFVASRSKFASGYPSVPYAKGFLYSGEQHEDDHHATAEP
jgi:hypothetical protein